MLSPEPGFSLFESSFRTKEITETIELLLSKEDYNNTIGLFKELRELIFVENTNQDSNKELISRLLDGHDSPKNFTRESFDDFYDIAN